MLALGGMALLGRPLFRRLSQLGPVPLVLFAALASAQPIPTGHGMHHGGAAPSTPAGSGAPPDLA